MKLIKSALFVLFISLMASCSSDDASPVENNGPETTYFNYTLDGEDVTMTIFGGYISGNNIFVSAGAANGTSIQLGFNKFGDIGSVTSFSTQSATFPTRHSYAYVRENHFDLNIVSISGGQAKVNFSGKLYDDEYDLQSEFSTVEGSFVVNLQEAPPLIPGLGVSATINGNAWHDIESSTSSGSEYSLNFDSDDEYGISFFINPNNVVVGNYTFNNNSQINKVVLYKFNLDLGYPDTMDSTSGTFNITSKSVVSGFTIIEGTFTLNATHPETGQVITVTNGAFKAAYDF